MLFVNIALLAVIVFAAVAYLFFKTKQFRSEFPIRKKWYKAKAGVALGLFMAAFGLNTALLFNDAIAYIIGAIFIAIGLSFISNDVKRARHEGKFVKEEYDLNKPTT